MIQQRAFRSRLLAALLLATTAAPLPSAEPAAPAEAGASATARPPRVEVVRQEVAASDGGLWPNVATLADGSLFLTGFNQPSHTIHPGEVDGWASTDEGRTWERRGSILERPDAASNRVNHAVGVLPGGDLIAAVSGYADSADTAGKRRFLPSVVRRSRDGGRTWSTVADFDAGLRPLFAPIPFGAILTAEDGSLRMVVYMNQQPNLTPSTASAEAKKPIYGAYYVTSRDEGKTWGGAVKLGDGLNETALLHLGKGNWIAASRTGPRPAPEQGERLKLLRSGDDGRTWVDEGFLSGAKRMPAHLLRLKDGRIVLAYGNRAEGAVDLRFSSDEGKTWSPVRRLVDLGGDLGYPSSAQLSDGLVLTAFYAQKSPLQRKYHAGAVVWKPESPEATAAGAAPPEKLALVPPPSTAPQAAGAKAAEAKADGTQPAAAVAREGDAIDQWHGFTRRSFKVAGHKAWIVEPKPGTELTGRPWSWCLMFPDAFTPRCAAPQLLAAGFHHAYVDVGNSFGSPDALKLLSAFYDHLQERGFAKKTNLVGISRGGLYSYRWASENADKVSVIYGDAPVCDFKSWPGGKGKGKGSANDWKQLLQHYRFKDDAEALAYAGNPIDQLAPLAKAGVALVHVVGDADDVVPVAENTALVEARYRELKGEIEVIHKPNVGHHPHGLDDPDPVVKFILKRVDSAK